MYKVSGKKNIALDDIYILSIGTGISPKSISKANWGKIQWATKLFDIMMQGNSQSVHKQLEAIFKAVDKNYLRLNISIERSKSDMDDASPETREILIQEVNKQIINNAVKLYEIESFINNAGL